MSKKYELTNASIRVDGRKLNRIRALRDFFDVKAGDFGGYVQSEENLSQEGDCWIYDDGKVYDNAIVKDNAVIKHSVIIRDQAKICGNAIIKEYSKIVDNAQIRDMVNIMGYALISDNAIIEGQTEVGEYAKIYGNSRVSGKSSIGGMVAIEDSAIIDNASISGNIRIFENAIICGNERCQVYILGEAEIGEDALIQNNTDYATVRGFGRHRGLTTFFRRGDNEIGFISGSVQGKSLRDFHDYVIGTTCGKITEKWLLIEYLMETYFKEGN